MKKTIVLTSLFSLFVLATTVTSAKSVDNIQQQAPSNTKSTIKWLGVSLTKLSNAMHSQLGNLITTDEGILIKDVQPNSPAEKAGLQAYDILTQFNATKVNSAQQVYQFVQGTKENQETKLEIIRAGKKQTVFAKIGFREVSHTQPRQHSQNQFGFPQFNNQFFNGPNWNTPFSQPNWQGFSMPNFPAFPNNFQGKNNNQNWSRSESLNIKTMENGKIRAELKTKDTNGNEKNFVFEDKPEVVIKQIQEQKDLPQSQKQNLINSIQGNPTRGFNNNFFNNGFFGNRGGFPQGPFANKWYGAPPQNKSIY